MQSKVDLFRVVGLANFNGIDLGHIGPQRLKQHETLCLVKYQTLVAGVQIIGVRLPWTVPAAVGVD